MYIYIYIYIGLGFRSITEYEMEDEIELGIIPWFIKIWGSNVHCVYIYIYIYLYVYVCMCVLRCQNSGPILGALNGRCGSMGTQKGP